MIEVVLRSVLVALAATTLLAPGAIAAGWWLARSMSTLRPLVSNLLILPLVLPPVVVGWVLLALLGTHGPVGIPLGSLGIYVPFSTAAAVLAAMVVGLPLFVTSARAAFEAVDPRLEEVALSSGDRPLAVFRRVTLPLAVPGLAAGAVLSFARALSEFGATIVLAGDSPSTRTLAIAVYAGLDDPQGGTVLPLVLASVAIGAAALVLYEVLIQWQRRRLEVYDR